MTPATIIREAQADGVRLTLSPTGTIKATGDGAAVNRWLPVIRERKAEIIDVLKVGAGGDSTMTLSALIRKRDTGKLATAIPAIPATQPKGEAATVARIATVAVANPEEVKPATPAAIVSADATAAVFDQEWFEERAAIYEFDAGFSRQEAERRAYLEVTTTWLH